MPRPKVPIATHHDRIGTLEPAAHQQRIATQVRQQTEGITVRPAETRAVHQERRVAMIQRLRAFIDQQTYSLPGMGGRGDDADGADG